MAPERFKRVAYEIEMLCLFPGRLDPVVVEPQRHANIAEARHEVPVQIDHLVAPSHGHLGDAVTEEAAPVLEQDLAARAPQLAVRPCHDGLTARGAQHGGGVGEAEGKELDLLHVHELRARAQGEGERGDGGSPYPGRDACNVHFVRGIILGLMAAPIMTSIAEDSLKAVPDRYREAAEALAPALETADALDLAPLLAPGGTA